MSVKKIAKLAGVSVATVSRVMHKSDKVKPDTQRRVEEAMMQLGLTSGELIRGVKSDSCVVGVVVPDLSNIFFMKVIAGIRQAASDRNLHLFVCDTHEDDQSEVHYLRLLKEAKVQGIIITPTSDDDDCINNEYLNMLSDMSIPIVLIDRDVKYSNFPGVFIDNLRGAFDATKRLLDCGHTNIAIVAGPINTKPGRERLQGYRDAFASKKVPMDERHIYYGDFGIESGRTLCERILKEQPEVTAIFSCNNLMTLGCLAALRQHGKAIPDDVALIGFDEIETLDMLGIDLTTVYRPTREMGEQAIKQLFSLINKKPTTVLRRITLMPKLVCKGSEILVGSKAEEREEKK